MEDFCQNACLVAGGHMTNVPATYTYVSVEKCETVIITLMLASLNLLDVTTTNIMDAYNTTLCNFIMDHPRL